MLFLTVWDFPSPTHTVLFLTAEAKTLCLLHSVVLHSRGQEIPSSTQTQCSSSQQRLRHSISDTDTVFFLAVEAKTCLLPRHSAVPHSRGWHIMLLTHSAIPHKWQERLTDLLMQGKMDRGGDGAQGDLAWHRCLATRPAPPCKRLWCRPPPGPQPPDRTVTLQDTKPVSSQVHFLPPASLPLLLIYLQLCHNLRSTKYMGESSDFQGYSKWM